MGVKIEAGNNWVLEKHNEGSPRYGGRVHRLTPPSVVSCIDNGPRLTSWITGVHQLGGVTVRTYIAHSTIEGALDMAVWIKGEVHYSEENGSFTLIGSSSAVRFGIAGTPNFLQITNQAEPKVKLRTLF